MIQENLSNQALQICRKRSQLRGFQRQYGVVNDGQGAIGDGQWAIGNRNT